MPHFEYISKPGFRENRLLSSWKSGKNTINGWLAFPDPNCTEAMAHAGWDSLTIDMQHGLIDYSGALQMLMAISTTPVIPLVRVPWLEEGIIMKVLDAGAYGVICPMINTKSDAERFASITKYPPLGIRSFGPIRVKHYSGEDYEVHANSSVISIAMIETQTSINNLEEILSVGGIDAVYIGPADLSLTFGVKPMFDQEDPVVVSAIEHIIKTVRKSGKYVGVHNGTVEYAGRMIKAGANFVSVASDQRILSAGAARIVADFKKLNI